MTWTKTKPTEPGEYWVIGEFSDRPYMVRLRKDGAALHMDNSDAKYVTHWGPLIPRPDPPKETELSAEQGEVDNLREQLDHAQRTIARLRAEVKRKVANECGVWRCEWCRKPHGPEVEPAEADDEGCYMCAACYEKAKAEVEPWSGPNEPGSMGLDGGARP